MIEAQDDEAVEKWLSTTLVAEPLVDDDQFTAAVLKRIDRAASRRRALLMIGYVAAVVVAFVSLPDASASWASVTPAALAGLMTLSSLCSVVWIATMD